jgi:hypothetical protein
MPPARRSATSKPASTARGVRARATATSAATRREVEQSITRFEKRLDDANDALQALGKTLGRGAQSSYKDVTAALRALRRDAAKTNRQALKDFDKLRSALTQSNSRAGSATTRSGAKRSTTTRSTSGRSTSGRSTSGRSTSGRSAASRSTSSRSTTSRSTGSRSTGTQSTRSRSTGTRSTGSRSGGSRSTGSN